MSNFSFDKNALQNLVDNVKLFSSSPVLPSTPSVVKNFSMADYTYKIIEKQIKDFEDRLDDNHEVALKLTSFGQSITLAVSEIGYANPSTLIFYGFVGEQPATLIQHMSQLNFLLLSVEKSDPAKPPRRIGFVPPSED